MRNDDKRNGGKKNGQEAENPERDTRFDVFRKNPIYRRVPQNQRKVQIDSRFKSMFHDDQFKLKYKVDKRGRPIDTSTNENLKKYYQLDKGSDESGDDNEVSDTSENTKLNSTKTKAKINDNDDDDDEPQSSEESESESEKSDDEEDGKNVEGDVAESEIRKRDKSAALGKAIKKKLRNTKVDYARGEGDFVSEESDDSSSSEEDEAEDISHAWGELDHDCERTEDSSRRLALCNMDWDRVKAVDLMVLFNSFLPSNGVLKRLSIYPSEFGKERMAEEEIHGPVELRTGVVKKEESDSDAEEEDSAEVPDEEEDEEGSAFHMEKLRKYQLSRLKYYYAVLEFDSVEAAEKVYTECNGLEYESSATLIDLRYIPDDMEFDEKDVKDQCDKVVDAEKYRPRFFTTTALQQGKVDLTWDETDLARKELTARVFDPKDDVDDDDIRAYLASSSESEDEIINENDGESDDGTVSNADPVAKYRALLESIEDTEKKRKAKDTEMEITWGVGLREKTQSMVKDKLEKQAAAKLTPWEEMLAKKKERSKTKKQLKKKQGVDEEEEEDEGQAFSDDDVDVDFDDPFFQDMSTKSSKKNSTKKQADVPANDDADKAALELLMMDDEDHKNHFNLKSIIDRETTSKSKKKKLKKKDFKNKVTKTEETDDFKLDVGDDRFSALFSSHLFNVDPSDPNFKNTNAMKTIVTEKQKRRLATIERSKVGASSSSMDPEQPPEPKKTKGISAELSCLVKSIQRNTKNNLKKKQEKSLR